MVVMGERETLLRSLKGYLEDLVESGVDELLFAQTQAPEKAAQPEAPVNRTPSALSAPEDLCREDAAPRKEAAVAGADPLPQQEAIADREEGVEFRMEGNPRARLLFIASGDGFSGEAGGLLERIIVAMQFSREDVCLLSFAPCSGPQFDSLRAKAADAVASVAPEAIVTLGEPATHLIVQGGKPLEQLRGKFHAHHGIPVMPTFHPEAMLADETLKRDVWKDMQQVMRRLAPED